MAAAIILPKQGWSMDEALFVEWLKDAGERVAAGEPLFSVETDKAIQEIEALDSGVLHRLPDGPQADDAVKIGDVIGYLLEPGEAAPATEVATARGSAEPPPTPPAPMAPAGVPPVTASAASVGRPVSPRAARRAVAAGVDLRSIPGTGRGGRIRECDVVAAIGQAPAAAAPAGHELPVGGLRQKIAERMVRSRTLTAPVTLTTRADATALVKFRAAAKARSPSAVLSYNDVLMKLAAEALREHPALNARWDANGIVQPDTVNIGLAVDTDDGLLVPVVRDVTALTLSQLASRTADLVARARQRQLSADELSGGTFTLTSLGAMGVDMFTPIINHPECAVLGIGRIVREPVVVGDNIEIQDRLWLSLTFDHRIVDGGPAARFLETLRHLVENPPRPVREDEGIWAE